MWHGRDIARWKRALKHVRFCPPEDHYVRDREIFEVAIEIPETESAFLELCASLGIDVKRIQPEDNVAQVGTSYKPDVWKTLKFPVPAFPDLAQPGHVNLAGAPVHVWIRGRYLEVLVAPAVGPDRADENDFLRAKLVDDLLSSRSDLRFRDS
jgi:hypothetical protein